MRCIQKIIPGYGCSLPTGPHLPENLGAARSLYITALENFATSSLRCNPIFLRTASKLLRSQADRPAGCVRSTSVPDERKPPVKVGGHEKTHSSSIDHRCGNRGESPMRLDPRTQRLRRNVNMGLPEHRAPTVSSAQHWYPVALTNRNLVGTGTIGGRGVGGGIPTDEVREIDGGTCGSLSGFFPSRAQPDSLRMGFYC